MRYAVLLGGGTKAPICNSNAFEHTNKTFFVWSTHCSAFFTILQVAGTAAGFAAAAICAAVLEKRVLLVVPWSMLAISHWKLSRWPAESKVKIVRSLWSGEENAYLPSSMVFSTPEAKSWNDGCGLSEGLQTVAVVDEVGDAVVVVVGVVFDLDSPFA